MGIKTACTCVHAVILYQSTQLNSRLIHTEKGKYFAKLILNRIYIFLIQINLLVHKMN